MVIVKIPFLYQSHFIASNYAGSNNAALWQILAHNNSLKFRPFSASEYSLEVHRATYICKASSESGTILSRVVNVKAGKKSKAQIKSFPFREKTWRRYKFCSFFFKIILGCNSASCHSSCPRNSYSK